MASSRIFIKGLPPTLTETEFRKHFSSQREITDAKIFPNRRIGYVGYKTPEDAQKAVKYFNRTFIRMSKIGVEIARPVGDAMSVKPGRSRNAPTARFDDGVVAGRAEMKSKKGDGEKKLEKDDPKLKEFMEAMKPKSKRKAWEMEEQPVETQQNPEVGDSSVAVEEAQSDEEYEEVPKKAKRRKGSSDAQEELPEIADSSSKQPVMDDTEQQAVEEALEAPADQATVSDSDWARSRTSRLLGLLDDDEEETAAQHKATIESHGSDDEPEPAKGISKAQEPESSMPTPPSDNQEDSHDQAADTDVGGARSSMRLFVRNLPYDVKEQDLEAEFESYGNLDEVHVPLDKKSGSAKGFAYLQFSDPDSAQTAMQEKDGQTFQGRLLHIIPAEAKRDTKLDDFALSKLPLRKQQQIKRRRDAASTNFNWNALYMNADAVISSVADRLGLAKSEVLDPTSSEAAIKQAHAETHIIQETKAFFKQQGVDLDAFKKSQRGDTAILVKNIPYDCSSDELKRMFEEHGEVKRFLCPPSGVIAIIEFANAAQCKAAFGALAYRKVKSSVLFLEKAPKGLFDAKKETIAQPDAPAGVSKTSASDLKNSENAATNATTSTLFVRNLNFSTTTTHLTDTFKPLEGFLSARVKTKTDPKKPGQILSMGFGFLEFRSAAQAQAALKSMDGYTLEGHKLQIRASHKGLDAAEERKRTDAEKKSTGKKTKVIIKNLPFEASKKDVRALFGAYGQLRSVRVPKKMDRAARGFGFAEFTTPKEAESAMEALKDTHLLGRRLVLDFADEDPENAEAEIEKMQQKVGSQVNKVALQKLTGGGRKKFSTQVEEDGS